MVLRVINRIEEAIICLLLVATTLLVFMDVVMRFGFNSGYIWSQELTLLLCAWMVLFGASYVLKIGSHIGMDAFVKLFSSTTRKIITGVGCVLSLIYCGLVMYGAWIYLSKMKKIGIAMEDLPIPTWVAHSILLIGFALLSIRIVLLLRAVVFGDTEGFRKTDEVKESLEIAEQLAREEGRI